jgi:hypothetical protein
MTTDRNHYLSPIGSIVQLIYRSAAYLRVTQEVDQQI